MAEKLTAAVTVKLCDVRMTRGSALAQRKGMCVSEFMRHLIKLEARRRAMARVSEQQRLRDMEEPAQVLRSGS